MFFAGLGMGFLAFINKLSELAFGDGFFKVHL